MPGQSCSRAKLRARSDSSESRQSSSFVTESNDQARPVGLIYFHSIPYSVGTSEGERHEKIVSLSD